MSQVYIITGGKMSGKTSRCLEYAQKLIIKGYSVGGFVAIGQIEEGKRSGFFLKNLKTNERIEFAQREAQEGWELIHSFYFNPKAIDKGIKWLRESQQNCDFIFIDEVGRFDLQGKIWGPILIELLNSSGNLVLSIRDVFVEEVIDHFNIEKYKMASSLKDFL